jgi:hypothetical protein
MTKIGTFLGLVLAAVVITMVFRWLRDRATGRRGAFSADNAGDNMAPGASFSQRPQPDRTESDAGDSDAGGDGGGD